MRIAFVTTLLAGVLAVGGVAFAASDDECAKAWGKLHAAVEGSVTEAEAGSYFAALKAANKSVANGKLTKVAFLQYCKDGTFNIAKANQAAGGNQ